MTDFWNAKTYTQFLDLRTRPARDLLAAIPDSFQPKTVYDLGETTIFQADKTKFKLGLARLTPNIPNNISPVNSMSHKFLPCKSDRN